MKSIRVAMCALTVVAFSAAAEDFTGVFTGSYASGWTALINDDPVATAPSDFDLQSYSLTLRGSSSPSPDPVGTRSLIEYTHPVVGTGPTGVSFTSLFYTELTAHENDSAAFLVNGQVRQDLSTVSQSQQFSFTLNPGDTFGFRLTSDNDNIRDVLQVTANPVPEPGVGALAALGAGLLMIVRSWRKVA